jgi:uncharacterized protein (DUF1330 family)
MIIDVEKVLDPAGYLEYCKKVPAMVNRAGGKYLARCNDPVPLEGGWHPEKMVIIEFSSRKEFDGWWNSPEYREIAPLRERSALARTVIIEGC